VKVSFEDAGWVKLPQSPASWRAAALAMLNSWILLQVVSQSVSDISLHRAYMYTYVISIFFQLVSTVLIRPWPSLMDFSIHRYLVGLLGWGISPKQGLYPNTGQHNTETRRHTSMPRAGFEIVISMFKRS
jgi:hypothetical protein